MSQNCMTHILPQKTLEAMTVDHVVPASTEESVLKEGFLSEETLEQQILAFPVYQHFIDSFQKFTSTNTKTLDVVERLYPNLTGATLSGPHKIAYRSQTLYFIDDYHFQFNEITDPDDRDNYSITFLRLGDALSGHKGIVHGGLLATLLDELTCRVGFLNFESKRGVTANLNVNYKQPTKVDSWVCIKCTVFKKIGRKCWVKGDVYLIDETKKFLEDCELLTSCEVLIVEPKWVDQLKH